MRTHPAGRDWVREFVLPYSGLLATTVQEKAYARHQQELATPYNFMLRRTLVDAVLLCLPPLADAIEHQFGAASPDDSSGGGSGSGSSSCSGSSSSVGGGGAGSASRRSQGSSDGEAGEQAGRVISALTMLFNAVDADIMQQGFAEASDGPSNLLGGMRAGVRIALVLPLQPPAGVPSGILSMAHLAAAHFISDTADSLLQRPRVAEVWEQRNDGGSSEQPLPGEAEAEEAASLVLQVLPRLAVVLPHLAASEPDNSILSCLVGRYAAPMQLPHLLGEFRTADQVAQWAAAAEAALRLLPLLASRIAQAEPDGGQAAGQQQAAGEEEADSDQSVTEDLVSYLVRHVWHGGAKRLARWAQQGGEDAGDDEAAEEQQAGHGSSEGEQQAGHGSSGGSQLQEGEQQQDERISEGSQPEGSGSIDSPVRQHLPPPELTAQLCQLHSTACRLLALGAAAPVAQQQWWLETSIKLAASLRLVLHTLRVLLVQRGDQELLRCAGCCLLGAGGQAKVTTHAAFVKASDKSPSTARRLPGQCFACTRNAVLQARYHNLRMSSSGVQRAALRCSLQRAPGVTAAAAGCHSRPAGRRCAAHECTLAASRRGGRRPAASRLPAGQR